MEISKHMYLYSIALSKRNGPSIDVYFLHSLYFFSPIIENKTQNKEATK